MIRFTSRIVFFISTATALFSHREGIKAALTTLRSKGRVIDVTSARKLFSAPIPVRSRALFRVLKTIGGYLNDY